MLKKLLVFFSVYRMISVGPKEVQRPNMVGNLLREMKKVGGILRVVEGTWMIVKELHLPIGIMPG